MKNIKWMLVLFLIVPVIFSLISTVHLVSFVNIGNPYYLSVMFAITVELGAIVTFITISPNILDKLNKNIILYMFLLLFGLQAVGNMYSVYDYVLGKLAIDPSWLSTFDKMTLHMLSGDQLVLLISILLGLVVPIFSIFLLKSAIDYMYSNKESIGDALGDTDDVKGEFKNKEKVIIPKKEAVIKTHKVPVTETKDYSEIKELFKENIIETTNEEKNEENATGDSRSRELTPLEKLKHMSSDKTINIKP